MFFGSAPDLEKHLMRIEYRAVEGIRIVVLRLKRVRNTDAVCLGLLEDFLKRMKSHGVRVLLCGVRHDLFRTLSNVGLTAWLGKDNIYPESSAAWSSTLSAVRAAHSMLGNDLCPHCPTRHNNPKEADNWHYMI